MTYRLAEIFHKSLKRPRKWLQSSSVCVCVCVCVCVIERRGCLWEFGLPAVVKSVPLWELRV